MGALRPLSDVGSKRIAALTRMTPSVISLCTLTLNDLPKTSLIWRINVRPAGLSCKISVIWCTVYKTSHVSLHEEGQVSDFTGGEPPQGGKPRRLEQVPAAVRGFHSAGATTRRASHWRSGFIFWSSRRPPPPASQ